MSQNTPPPTRRAQRPPRINLKNLQNNGAATPLPPTAQPPFTAHSNPSMMGGSAAAAGQPYWPQYANPFAGGGNFVVKGFEGFVDFTKSGMSFGEKFTYGLYNKFSKWSKKWFTHMFLFIVVTLYTLGGAALFMAIEGPVAIRTSKQSISAEKTFYAAMHTLARDTETLKYEKINFNGQLRLLIHEHSAAITAIINERDGLTLEQRNETQNPWNLWNTMFYCGTIYTTIGYGNLTPKTELGKSLTIIYAIIGIPMFLILLADFGKLFTRGLKFLWAYVRRLYYTGTCRQIRKQQQVRDAMSGFNTVYDMAMRRSSQFFGAAPETDIESQASEAGAAGDRSLAASHPETPTSPYPETFEIDDEFNLPVSVATFLLITYILIGSLMYMIAEDGWSYFDSFYFVFISMSTIGFGDLAPNNPISMIGSILYLIFGLALTSMFINVVQIKLSDTFKQASTKISATIGLGLASEMGDEAGSQIKTPSDLASVHGSRLDKIAEDESEVTLPTSQPPLTSILRAPRPISPSTNDSDAEQLAPPLMPRRQVAMEQPPEQEKKKKRRFFK